MEQMITLPLASGKIVDALKYNTKLMAMIKVHQIVFSRRSFLFLYRKNWGLPITQTNLRVLGDSGLVGWQMARQGLGLSAMPDNIAHHFPEMKLVLPQLEPIPVPYWLTTHKELHSSKRIRLVYDRIAETLSANKLPVRVG